MKIGLIDADLMDKGTRHPNLALMKIAGYYRDNGNEVKLIYESYDEVREYDMIFMSKVFSFTRVPEWLLELDNIEIGGTGFFEDGGNNLPNEIEHHMPFYNLYKEYVEREISQGRKRQTFSDYLDYSIGFTTRGCFRKCSFCVNKKYDRVQQHSPVTEFLDETRPYIYLWDDNILAFPQWREIIEELEKTGRQFQFRQGIDLRLMTDEKAKIFNSVHYQGDFIFAFDHIADKDRIIEKVQMWKRYTSKVCKMYVLSGYDSQDEYDIENVFKRISILMKYGSLPYIMRYEAYKESKFRGIYVELARWCNQPQFFKKKSFREFCVANQNYKKNQATNCAAYQSMIDFESEFPEIAKKYFDLKFENENIYKLQYGYGRKYANKPQCQYCMKNNVCWQHCIESNDNKKLLELYFTKELDMLCLDYANSECNLNSNDAAKYVLNLIQKTSVDEIIKCICNSSNRECVTAENIPQYSEIKNSINKVPEILMQRKNKTISFEEMGFLLEGENSAEEKSQMALKKYGENHCKLACLLDLAHISKSGVRSEIRITKLGEVYNALPKDEKEDIAIKLFLRIPIIQNRFIEDKGINTINRDFKILSEKTQKRRGSYVQNMVRSIIRKSLSFKMSDFNDLG